MVRTGGAWDKPEPKHMRRAISDQGNEPPPCSEGNRGRERAWGGGPRQAKRGRPRAESESDSDRETEGRARRGREERPLTSPRRVRERMAAEDWWERVVDYLERGELPMGRQLGLLLFQIPRQHDSFPKAQDYGVATTHALMSRNAGNCGIEGANDDSTVVLKALQSSGLLGQRKGGTRADMEITV